MHWQGVQQGAGTYSVTTGRGEGVDLQHCVVRGDGLERDIGVPAGAGETAHVAQLVCEAASLLLLLAADNANLVTELATLLGQGVDVKT